MWNVIRSRLLRALALLTLTSAMTGCVSLNELDGPVLVPVQVVERDLAACAALPELTSRKAAVLTPWAIDVVKKYNECAADKASLADKVKAHNAKGE